MKAPSSMNNSVGIFLETYRYLQKSKDPQYKLDDLKGQWAQSVLSRLRVNLEIVGEVSSEKSILFVGNHISYLDIPLLMSVAPNVSFVAKEELSQWPVFGDAAKAVDTVFVKRESQTSRVSAKESVKAALNSGKRVAIFPSGTTCVVESQPWKKGAFKIAYEAQVLIQPFRISYSPLRQVAYIDRDFFPTHLYKLSKFEKIEARIEFHKPVQVSNPTWDCMHWYYWSKGIVDAANTQD